MWKGDCPCHASQDKLVLDKIEQRKCPKCGGERDIEEAPFCWHCKDCPFAKCAEVKPELESKSEEAHHTEYGYCCACEFDIAVMNDKIAQAHKQGQEDEAVAHQKEDIKVREDTLDQIKDIVGRLGVQYRGDGLIVHRGDAYQLFSEDLLSELDKIE